MAGNWNCICPACRANLLLDIDNLTVKLDSVHFPDKPPGVGDWGLLPSGDTPYKVIKVEARSLGDGGIDWNWKVWVNDGGSWWWGDDQIHIVRRKDAPLQKGDRGLLGNVEVWVNRPVRGDDTIQVVFAEDQVKSVMPLELAWIDRSRFTLVEPVWDGKEKTDG